MTSRQRVLTALRCEQPDRVPYCETRIDRSLANKLLGWDKHTNQQENREANSYTVEEAKELARFLRQDNISFVMRAPIYSEKIPGLDGRLFYGNGLIKTEPDLALINLPDPNDDALYSDAKRYVEGKEEFACFFITRMGIAPTILSMGLDTFSIALYENRPLVEAVLDRYCNWTCSVAEKACTMGFDVFVTTDDVAFKSAPFFSPQVFEELVLPRYRRLVENITLPWIIHSDGNILPFIPYYLDLNVSGIHPNEKGALDIRYMKQQYGDTVCLLGNVDLNILGKDTPADVEREVRDLIRDVGPGGGYIVTSGNSLAGYLLPENVVALSKAVEQYGRYPLAM